MNKSHKRLLFALTAVGVLAIGAFAMTDKTWLGVKAETTTYSLTLASYPPYNNDVSVAYSTSPQPFTANTNLGNSVRFSYIGLSSPDPHPASGEFAGKTGSSFQNADPLNGLTSITIAGFGVAGTNYDTASSFPSVIVSGNASFSSPTTLDLSYQANGRTSTFNGVTVQKYKGTGTISGSGLNYAKVIFNSTDYWWLETANYTYTCVGPTATGTSSSDGGVEQTTSHISGQPLSLP